MNINSIFSWVQGVIKIRGNSDNTIIGNVGDRLKTDVIISANSASDAVRSNRVYSFCSNLNMAQSSLFNPLVLFRNPLGSGKRIQITEIAANISVKNEAADYRISVNDTITLDGTPVTILPRNINNSQPASVANVFSFPTVTVDGQNMDGLFNGQNTVVADFISSPIVLQPNSFFILRGMPLSNNRASTISFAWEEFT
jgi:hypothetical protein